MWNILAVILTAMTPVGELRLSIPLGVAMGLDLWTVLALSFVFNAIVFFPIYFCLEFLYHRLIARSSTARKYFEKIHKKGQKHIEKYGWLGLAMFIAIPLPATGVWTASFIAWLVEMDWKRAFLAVLVGVAVAMVIVTAVVLGAVSVWFLK